MMVAKSGMLNAQGVRTGYTHWIGPEIANAVRMFSGFASQNAVSNGTHIGLVFEHYLRLQTKLTQLMKKHIDLSENVNEFIREVKRLEQVHIVTRKENNILRRKSMNGDYDKAGIKLIHWNDIPKSNRSFLKKKLSGKVANEDSFTI